MGLEWLIPAVISGVGSLFGGLFSGWGQDKASRRAKEADEQNLAFQREKLEYEKQMQQEAWAREDNAVQRRRDDLVAAGMNPILAAGDAASASAPIDVTQLHTERGQIEMDAAAQKQQRMQSMMQSIMNAAQLGLSGQRAAMEQRNAEFSNQLLAAQKQVADANYANLQQDNLIKQQSLIEHTEENLMRKYEFHLLQNQGRARGDALSDIEKSIRFLEQYTNLNLKDLLAGKLEWLLKQRENMGDWLGNLNINFGHTLDAFKSAMNDATSQPHMQLTGKTLEYLYSFMGGGATFGNFIRNQWQNVFNKKGD